MHPMNCFSLFLLFPLLSFSFSQEPPISSSPSSSSSYPHVFPKPLIVEYSMETQFKPIDEDIKLHCDSWRFAVEANNVNPWKTVPEECGEYVRNYLVGKGYGFDLERASKEAGVFAKGFELNGDGKDVWIFDIDDTLLSNLPYYAQHGFGLEVFDHAEFAKWVEMAMAPPIKPSLKLFEEVTNLGFKIFLLTGRRENHRSATINNLINAGFHKWDRLILRDVEDQGKLAVVYKSEKRDKMANEGCRIIGNSGDQWSDLLGSTMSVRSFKLPNPMYYIP